MRHYVELYYDNKKAFIESLLLMIPLYFRMAIVKGYSPIIQAKVTNVSITMIFFGISSLFGAIILFMFMIGKIKMDIKKRMILFRTLITISSFATLLLTILPKHSTLTYIIYITSIVTWISSLSIFYSDYQYILFKKFNMENRVKITSLMLIMADIVKIIAMFMASTIYPHLTLLYTIVFAVDLFDIYNIYKIVDTNEIIYVGNAKKMWEMFSNDAKIIFMVFFVITGTISTINYYTPFAFAKLGEKYIGYMFIISSLVSMFIGYKIFPKISTTNKIIKRSYITTIISMMIFILSSISHYFLIVSVIIIPPLLRSILLSLRHYLFKTEENTNTWNLIAMKELTTSIGSIYNVITGTILTLSSVQIFQTFIMMMIIILVALIYLDKKNVIIN